MRGRERKRKEKFTINIFSSERMHITEFVGIELVEAGIRHGVVVVHWRRVVWREIRKKT